MAARRGRRGGRDGAPEYFARCAGGFEEVLAEELRTLGLRAVRPQVGGVSFVGPLADAYIACLWSRVATRVQLVLCRVPAHDAEALYEGVAGYAWERQVPVGATISVRAHGTNPELRNTSFTALKVKDALCDHLRAVRGVRPDVDVEAPDVAIDVAVHPQKATIYLNLSGDSLHRRGYREAGVQTEAPLKETLAAGILLSAGWGRLAEEGGWLVDPMCGSGTFAIEAALALCGRAPGLLRTRWGFEGWTGHDQGLWGRLLDEARSNVRPVEGVRVVAGDLDPDAVAIARANAERAGVADAIAFHVGDAADLGRHLRLLRGRDAGRGLVACNPPYGRRLLDESDLPQVRAALAAATDAVPRSWQLVLITPDAGVDTALGRLPRAVTCCHNGPLEVQVRRYELADEPLVVEVASPEGRTLPVRVAEANSVQFAARLRKDVRERTRWARRAQVESYRLYDADLPEYALSVDRYACAEGERSGGLVVVGEHRRPSSVDPVRALRRLADAAAVAGAMLGVAPGDVVCLPWPDRRRDGRGAAPREPRLETVVERGLRFVVDLSRTDGGLPLAQRGVRELAGSLGRDRRVAALFATSMPALAHALAGGARGAVLVDGSPQWLDGAARTLRLNGFGPGACRTVPADVLGWLAGEARAKHRYDLVIVVAPEWLSAHDAGGGEWDLRRDHVRLLAAAAGILTAGGDLILASSAPDLRLDLDALRGLGLLVRDASGEVVPHDFERSHDKPRCWVVRHAR